MTCDDYLYTSPWFYFFLLTLILFIIFIIVVENGEHFSTTSTSTSSITGVPRWVWFMFVFLIFFLFISFILYYYHVKNYQCDVIPTQPIYIVNMPPVNMPVYEPVYTPVYNDVCKPCSIPMVDRHIVEEEIIYKEDSTRYQYTDLDPIIPFDALNPFV